MFFLSSRRTRPSRFCSSGHTNRRCPSHKSRKFSTRSSSDTPGRFQPWLFTRDQRRAVLFPSEEQQVQQKVVSFLSSGTDTAAMGFARGVVCRHIVRPFTEYAEGLGSTREVVTEEAMRRSDVCCTIELPAAAVAEYSLPLAFRVQNKMRD